MFSWKFAPINGKYINKTLQILKMGGLERARAVFQQDF
jgi:hypothetical protein